MLQTGPFRLGVSMGDYQANQKNTVTLLLQIQEHDRDPWSTVTTATAHVDRADVLLGEVEQTRANWQYSGVFSPSAKWRIVTT